MYHVSAQGVDERMINVHYYYYYIRMCTHAHTHTHTHTPPLPPPKPNQKPGPKSNQSKTNQILFLFLKPNCFHFCCNVTAVTMDDIIDEHMHTLRQKEPNLVRPFSLCVFHSLLNVVKEMHDKNWAHRDLHGK